MTPYKSKEEIEKLFEEKWENNDFFYKSQITVSKITVTDFIHTIRKQDRKAIMEFVEKINVNGGGSGRRLQIQLLGYLEGLEKYNMKEAKKHKHIWKYNTASNVRVCEAPFPFIESCGEIEEITSQLKDSETYATEDKNSAKIPGQNL